MPLEYGCFKAGTGISDLIAVPGLVTTCRCKMLNTGLAHMGVGRARAEQEAETGDLVLSLKHPLMVQVVEYYRSRPDCSK